MTQPALLLFSLGPVQDFIAGARTTRDLLTASTILSFLSRKAQNASLLDGVETYYPKKASQEQNEQNQSFPNKFSLLLADYTQAEAVAQAACQAALTSWKDMGDQVRSYLSSLTHTPDWDTSWDLQLANLLEFNWVCLPLADLSPQTCRSGLAQANFKLDDRKRLRDFSYFNGDRRWKDTIDGQFEQMGPISGNSPDFWNNLRSQLDNQRSPARLGENERLSAISLTKRFARQRYPELGNSEGLRIRSTSDVATAAWKTRLEKLRGEQPEVDQAWQSYAKALQPYLQASREATNSNSISNLDGSFFYPETLQAVRPEYQDVAIPALRVLLGYLEPPPRYYALLLLDGDEMGKVLSGAKTASNQPARPPDAISSDLDNYAKLIGQLVQKHEGLQVYAGGDDALLLLPTENLLPCAIELRQAFPLIKTQETTLSFGVAIAHHKHPLQRVLAATRLAENKAKEHYKRNALAFSVLKRSGEMLEVGANWPLPEEAVDTRSIFHALHDLQDFFKQEWVSSKLPYRLRQEVALLMPTPDQKEELGSLTRPLLAEFRRLYARQSHAPDGDPATQQRVKELGQELEKFAENGAFENFVNLLLVTAFLARSNEER